MLNVDEKMFSDRASAGFRDDRIAAELWGQLE